MQWIVLGVLGLLYGLACWLNHQWDKALGREEEPSINTTALRASVKRSNRLSPGAIELWAICSAQSPENGLIYLLSKPDSEWPTRDELILAGILQPHGGIETGLFRINGRIRDLRSLPVAEGCDG